MRALILSLALLGAACASAPRTRTEDAHEHWMHSVLCMVDENVYWESHGSGWGGREDIPRTREAWNQAWAQQIAFNISDGGTQSIAAYFGPTGAADLSAFTIMQRRRAGLPELDFVNVQY